MQFSGKIVFPSLRNPEWDSDSHIDTISCGHFLNFLNFTLEIVFGRVQKILLKNPQKKTLDSEKFKSLTRKGSLNIMDVLE